MSKKVFQNPVAVCLFALFCCFLWGSAFPCIKIGYALLGIEGTGSILLFAGLRFFLAGLLVIAFGSVGAKRFLRPQRQSLPYVLILALAQTFLQYLFFYIGLSRCTGVKSSIVNATNVFFAILLS